MKRKRRHKRRLKPIAYVLIGLIIVLIGLIIFGITLLLTPTDVSQLINYDNNSESTIGSKICDINTWLVNLYSPNFCNNVYEISATASGEYTDKVFTGMGTSASIWLSRDLLLDEQHQYLSIVSEHIQEDNRSINCAIERMLLSNDVRKSIRLVYDPSVLV